MHTLYLSFVEVFEEVNSLGPLFFVSFFASSVIAVLSYSISEGSSGAAKLSSYECGFDSFEDARHTFQVHFYLIGILFLIFDLELMFLFPGAVTLAYLSFFGAGVMTLFLLMLSLGYAYEWFKGALQW
jgi:NADH-quinone oxidoreductase subunit A